MPLSCRSCRFPSRWQYSAGFTGDEAPHAVISIPVVRPKMRCIMACMDEKDSHAVHRCRGAEAVSLGLAFQQTIEIHQLLFDRTADVPVVRVGRVPQV